MPNDAPLNSGAVPEADVRDPATPIAAFDGVAAIWTTVYGGGSSSFLQERQHWNWSDVLRRLTPTGRWLPISTGEMELRKIRTIRPGIHTGGQQGPQPYGPLEPPDGRDHGCLLRREAHCGFEATAGSILGTAP